MGESVSFWSSVFSRPLFACLKLVGGRDLYAGSSGLLARLEGDCVFCSWERAGTVVSLGATWNRCVFRRLACIGSRAINFRRNSGAQNRAFLTGER